MALPPAGDDLLSYCLEEQGRWFEAEIDFIRQWFPEGGNAVDIGANLGAYSMELALRAGTGGKIWAFEPDLRPQAYLMQSREQNHLNNLLIEASALGGMEGEANFVLASDSVLSHVGGGSETGVRVPMTTLDRWHAKAGYPQIDFLKLDAEGAETEIIRGGRIFFERCKPLTLLEYRSPGDVNASAVEAMNGLGCKMFRYIPAQGVLAAVEPGKLGDDTPLNLLALFSDTISRLQGEGILSLLESHPTGTAESLKTTSAPSTPAGKYESCVKQLNRFLCGENSNDSTQELIRSWFFEQLGFSASCVTSCVRGIQALYDGRFGDPHPLAVRCGVGPPPVAAQYPAWFTASLLHRLDLQARPTSYFRPQESVSLLEQIEKLGFLSPGMARRLSTARRRVQRLGL